MAANESTTVSEKTIVDHGGGNNRADILELSNDVKSLAPSDVIVHKQTREVMLLQHAAIEQLHESVTEQETFIHGHLVSREEHFSKLKELEQSLQVDYVSRTDYKEVLDKLEQEQHSHAETKLQLMEVTDRLDFTLGEVEILNQQLIKEKETSQQIVDSLRSQIAKGNNRNKALNGKYTACQKQCEDLSARLAIHEATIQNLEQRLKLQQQQCVRKIEEIEVERKQDQYIACLLKQPQDNCAKRSINKKNSDVRPKR